MKLLNLKCLLFVPVCAFYIFVVNVCIHSSVITDTHTICNVVGLYIYDKSFIFEVPALARLDPHYFLIVRV
jgi:hypothetical protein